MTLIKILPLILIGLGLLVLCSLSGCVSAYQTFKKDVSPLLENAPEPSGDIITEDDLAHLPSLVQRYLRYTGIVGLERVHVARLKQDGQIRLSPDGKWKSLKGEEYFTIDTPAFVWYGEAKALPLISMGARDKYVSGKGNMLIKLTPMFTVGNVVGPDMDQGSLTRYFNEMMWFPTAFLNDNITWEPIDDISVKATIQDHGRSQTCTIFFNQEGQLTNFVAERYRDGDGMRMWSTPILKYGELNGLRLPVEGEAIWHLDEGDFAYIRLVITELDYNIAEMYC